MPDPSPRRPGPRVKLTHPDRVYWPDAGVTKQGLADYYAAVWPRIEPHVASRPLALLRCPTGIDGPRFFQKHPGKATAGRSSPPPTRPTPTTPRSSRWTAPRASPPWCRARRSRSTAGNPPSPTSSTPTRIVMDLDPGEGVTWPAMIEAAREVRARLEAAGLAAFVKTSGGKGLHVLAPLRPARAAGWTAVKAFTARMARAMAADAPDRYVATIAKAKRPGGSSSITCAMAATTPPWSPTVLAPGPARRSPCRSPGTTSAPISARRISP